MSEVPVKVESDNRPDVLWRAFTMDPRSLTLFSFRQPLVPGTSAEDDPNRIADGNERGVYMSTNRKMVETAYAHTSLGLGIQVPHFKDHGSLTNKIALPQCGVVVKIDTKHLAIRKPVIIPSLLAHYNNGFEGDEYIADTVPEGNYQVVRLVLSRWAHDAECLVVDVENPNDPIIMQKTIETIQNAFQQREEEAQRFAAFLKTQEPNLRMNEHLLMKKWLQYKMGRDGGT